MEEPKASEQKPKEQTAIPEIVIETKGNEKLRGSFPQDQLGDIVIRFNEKEYTLQKLIVSENSEYFKRFFKNSYYVQKIDIHKQELKSEAVYKVLALTYYHPLALSYESLFETFKVMSFLEMKFYIQEIDRKLLEMLPKLTLHQTAELITYAFFSKSQKVIQQLGEKIGRCIGVDISLAHSLSFSRLEFENFTTLALAMQDCFQAKGSSALSGENYFKACLDKLIDNYLAAKFSEEDKLSISSRKNDILYNLERQKNREQAHPGQQGAQYQNGADMQHHPLQYQLQGQRQPSPKQKQPQLFVEWKPEMQLTSQKYPPKANQGKNKEHKQGNRTAADASSSKQSSKYFTKQQKKESQNARNESGDESTQDNKDTVRISRNQSAKSQSASQNDELAPWDSQLSILGLSSHKYLLMPLAQADAQCLFFEIIKSLPNLLMLVLENNVTICIVSTCLQLAATLLKLRDPKLALLVTGSKAPLQIKNQETILAYQLVGENLGKTFKLSVGNDDLTISENCKSVFIKGFSNFQPLAEDKASQMKLAESQDQKISPELSQLTTGKELKIEKLLLYKMCE